jgi:hypothetical protein
MRKDFKKPTDNLAKVFIGAKIPLNIIEKMEKYHKKSQRSKFLTEAVVNYMATLDQNKESETKCDAQPAEAKTQ